MEFNLTVFAAVLAILGYSLNDSIIIADRIRELLIAKQSWKTEDINDQAVIATFSRTMVTSGTTLITVGALWIMGGAPLAGFSTAMFIGVLSGTWSSISIGTVLPEWLKLEPKHYLPVEIELRRSIIFKVKVLAPLILSGAFLCLFHAHQAMFHKSQIEL